ncbi:pentapeptide repeat-containing protein [Streptomyces chrestomyceticus]|uniref:pentapeptide repeat-containing protein n=1 Tax=Streptomyces chrestomyceticus TaxID=68185 RepID=UPI0019D2F670|nr:pentapeptide repeat-containing protein [Streptomyces chrestomyceticus]
MVIDLAGTYLRGAVLNGTNLTHADLTGADLTSADLGQTSGPALTSVGDPDHVRATVLSGARLHRTQPRQCQHAGCQTQRRGLTPRQPVPRLPGR